MNTEYGYLMAGIMKDTVGGTHQSVTARGFDFGGNTLFEKEYHSNEWQISLYARNANLNDSTFVFVGEKSVANNDTSYACVIWMNLLGDTLFTRDYKSPYYNGVETEGINWNKPTAIATSYDGQFIYYTAQIVHSNPTQNNFFIRKLTNQGDVVWTYVNPLGWYSSCQAIAFKNGQLWFIKDSNGFAQQYNVLSRLNDEFGTVDLEVELNGSGFPVVACGEMILDDDGAVCASHQLVGSTILPAMYKMSYNGNYIWHQVPDGPFSVEQSNDHLAKSDDDGFVSCSVKYEEILNNSNHKIWLWKVDQNGALQWERNYEYFNYDSTYHQLYNIAHDFKATPDGGFICAGEATALCLDWPACDSFSQQGWLLKVDGCGCLVPGCDENCSVSIDESEPENTHRYFKVGPNPASDDFYVYLSSIASMKNNLMLQFWDAQGKLLRNLPLKHDDTTYVIDIRTLPPGNYFLRLTDGSKVLQTEQVMVVR